MTCISRPRPESLSSSCTSSRRQLLAVDRVLAAAVAEQRAADRDLGVLDRQGAVGVVDREHDLGAAERAPRRGAGEDDVFHLAAAEGLRALLAHHPGEGVDDVRLAGAVRADDAGDARLEGESGRLGERLEPLEGQALQIHRPALRSRCECLRLRYRSARTAPRGTPRENRPRRRAAARPDHHSRRDARSATMGETFVTLPTAR